MGVDSTHRRASIFCTDAARGSRRDLDMTADRRSPSWLTLLVICLGFFMINLDATIVYIATPSIMSGLRVALDQVLWVYNGYLLAYAVLLITAARLGDLYGPRRLF